MSLTLGGGAAGGVSAPIDTKGSSKDALAKSRCKNRLVLTHILGRTP
jgi:hypothetical protein